MTDLIIILLITSSPPTVKISLIQTLNFHQFYISITSFPAEDVTVYSFMSFSDQFYISLWFMQLLHVIASYQQRCQSFYSPQLATLKLTHKNWLVIKLDLFYQRWKSKQCLTEEDSLLAYRLHIINNELLCSLTLCDDVISRRTYFPETVPGFLSFLFLRSPNVLVSLSDFKRKLH